MILSIIVTVSAGVGYTNVVCPRNGTQYLCIFAFFSVSEPQGFEYIDTARRHGHSTVLQVISEEITNKQSHPQTALWKTIPPSLCYQCTGGKYSRGKLQLCRPTSRHFDTQCINTMILTHGTLTQTDASHCLYRVTQKVTSLWSLTSLQCSDLYHVWLTSEAFSSKHCIIINCKTERVSCKNTCSKCLPFMIQLHCALDKMSPIAINQCHRNVIKAKTNGKKWISK